MKFSVTQLWVSLSIVRFWYTQNRKKEQNRKALNQTKLWTWNHTVARCLFKIILISCIISLSFSLISHSLFGIICCCIFIHLLLIFGAPEMDSQFIIFSVGSTNYSVSCTHYSVSCTHYSVSCTHYSVSCTHYSVGCTHYSVGCKHLLC